MRKTIQSSATGDVPHHAASICMAGGGLLLAWCTAECCQQKLQAILCARKSDATSIQSMVSAETYC
jgi:hypothetical protein